jgi:zinc transporter ZupT
MLGYSSIFSPGHTLGFAPGHKSFAPSHTSVLPPGHASSITPGHASSITPGHVSSITPLPQSMSLPFDASPLSKSVSSNITPSLNQHMPSLFHRSSRNMISSPQPTLLQQMAYISQTWQTNALPSFHPDRYETRLVDFKQKLFGNFDLPSLFMNNSIKWKWLPVGC